MKTVKKRKKENGILKIYKNTGSFIKQIIYTILNTRKKRESGAKPEKTFEVIVVRTHSIHYRLKVLED